jgi:hypothetical protein
MMKRLSTLVQELCTDAAAKDEILEDTISPNEFRAKGCGMTTLAKVIMH